MAKKFAKKILTLIFLLAIAVAVFFLGWVQYLVPIGSYGVLRSKTHGTSDRLIENGNLRWVWYRLIPTNVTVIPLSIQENTVSVDFSGALPSGATYAALAGLETDFSYNFQASFRYRLKPESLPALVDRENLLSQADLDTYLSRLSGDIENYAKVLLWSYGDNEKNLAEARETGSIAGFEQALASQYPDVEILGSTVKTLRFPDFVLYNEVKALYREYITTQRTDIRDTVGRIAADNIQNRRRLDELAGYGELLTKYPVLIQYLAIERGIPPNSE
jgi:hypothetical protein